MQFANCIRDTPAARPSRDVELFQPDAHAQLSATRSWYDHITTGRENPMGKTWYRNTNQRLTRGERLRLCPPSSTRRQQAPRGSGPAEEGLRSRSST